MSSFLNNIHPLLSRKKNDPSDVNFAILNAINSVLEDTERDTIEAKKQSSLKSATGKYLEIYGDWHGVYRRDGESDTRYRSRIITFVDMPRGTNQSIIRAVRRYLGDQNVGVEVYEPFNDIFILNKSKLNGSHGLMGDYYRFAVIQVNIGNPFDDDLIDYIYRFTPSGVKVHINYDPSLPRRNDTATDVAPSLFTMTALESEVQATWYSGLEEYIGGRIQLRDQDAVLEDYIINHSKLNSQDILTGSFVNGRDFYHVFGKASNLIPKLGSRMGDILSQVQDMEEADYLNTTNQSGASQVTTVNINPSEEVYMAWNIDQYLSKKYLGSNINIPRTKEDYANVLLGSEFTLTTRTGNRGVTYDFQAYNFLTRRWVTLHRELGNGSVKTFHTEVVNPIQYLNDNRIMVTRIKANTTFTLDLDYVALDYRKEVTS